VAGRLWQAGAGSWIILRQVSRLRHGRGHVLYSIWGSKILSFEGKEEMTEPKTPRQALKELREAVNDGLNRSLPYLGKYGAFLLPEDSWNTLAGLVNPKIARFDVLLKKREQGEELTPQEIDDALSFYMEDDPEMLYQHCEEVSGSEYSIPLNEIQMVKWDPRRPNAKAPWKATIFWKNGNQAWHMFFTENQKTHFLQTYTNLLGDQSA
jgi:hypothetical protein